MGKEGEGEVGGAVRRGGEGEEGDRPLSIVLVKVAYYATSSARFFPKLCSNYNRVWKLCYFLNECLKLKKTQK